MAVHWNEAGGEPPRLPGGGQVWAEGSTRKVRLTDSPPATTWVWDGCRVRLSAARNETELVQLILTAGSQDLTGVNVTVGVLTGPGGAMIGQDRVTLYREAYHTVAQPSDPYGYGPPAGALDPGAIPDALIPFRDPYDPGRLVGAPFGVAAGRNQPIWIDLAVPMGTRYRTEQRAVTVAAGAEITRDVALTRVAEESLGLSSFEAAGELGEWEFANTLSARWVSGHATDGSYALKIVFNDDVALAQAGEWPAAGVGTFPTSNWSAYTALEFDIRRGQWVTALSLGTTRHGLSGFHSFYVSASHLLQICALG